jgi:hypothetical protein
MTFVPYEKNLESLVKEAITQLTPPNSTRNRVDNSPLHLKLKKLKDSTNAATVNKTQ